MEQNLTPKQSLELLVQVATQFRGTRIEHELIEKAFKVLGELIEPKE